MKINLQKLVDIHGYELPTNMQNFTQKELTEVKIFQSFRWLIFEPPCRQCPLSCVPLATCPRIHPHEGCPKSIYPLIIQANNSTTV